MRKLFTALFLVIAAVALVPVTTAEPFCEIEPCCLSGSMDCCTIESAPAPSPELVLTDSVRVSQPTDVTIAATPSSVDVVTADVRRHAEDLPFAESSPDRLALLSTYLI